LYSTHVARPGSKGSIFDAVTGDGEACAGVMSEEIFSASPTTGVTLAEGAMEPGKQIHPDMTTAASTMMQSGVRYFKRTLRNT
jgi:hypothetical protein